MACGRRRAATGGELASRRGGRGTAPARQRAVDDPRTPASTWAASSPRRHDRYLTDGAAPALAGLLREALDAALPSERR